METPRDANEMLEVLDEFLAHEGIGPSHVWDILTGLRSLDDQEYEPGTNAAIQRGQFKDQTAGRIRLAALPKTVAAYNSSCWGGFGSFRPVAPKEMPKKLERFSGNYHFNQHYEAAVRALEYIGRKVEP